MKWLMNAALEKLREGYVIWTELMWYSDEIFLVKRGAPTETLPWPVFLALMAKDKITLKSSTPESRVWGLADGG